MMNGRWTELQTIDDNCMRLIRLRVDKKIEGARFILEKTWGAEKSRVYAFYVD